MTPIPTYRTQLHRTDRILKDWVLKERLAFDRAQSNSVLELASVLPKSCKEQLGELKPTDAVFRKLSSGFNNVSDVWIELNRFIGIEDFSAEQAIFGTVSVFLDKENVRVKLNKIKDEPSRLNSIEVFCLNEPDYQGMIVYEGNCLSFPSSIFKAIIERRLNVYNLNCEDLSDVLLIPLDLDENLLDSPELETKRITEAKATDVKPKVMVENTTLIGESKSEEEEEEEEEDNSIESPELEAERNEEAKKDAYLEAMADDGSSLIPFSNSLNPKIDRMVSLEEKEEVEAARMAEIYSGDLPGDDSDLES